MSPRKYLNPSEIPNIIARNSLDFNSQKSDNGKIVILGTCPRCEKQIWHYVSFVRSRKNTFSGYCKNCYIAPKDKKWKKLQIDEVRKEIREYIYFNEQELYGGKAHINVKCKRCGKIWKSSVNNIRHSYSFTTLCKDCRNKDEYNPNWIAWRREIKRDGYVAVKISNLDPIYEFIKPALHKNGKILEHRLVMSIKLNRILMRYEHVHHINHIKTDNRPENLEIVTPTNHAVITDLEREIKRLQKENTELRNEINLYKLFQSIKVAA